MLEGIIEGRLRDRDPVLAEIKDEGMENILTFTHMCLFPGSKGPHTPFNKLAGLRGGNHLYVGLWQQNDDLELPRGRLQKGLIEL